MIDSGVLNEFTIYSLELPGRGIRRGEPFQLSLDEIKEECLNAIKPYLQEQMIFIGHSMGAVVAYELLCSLEQLYPDQYQSSLVISAANSPRSLKLKHDVRSMSEEAFQRYVTSMGGIPEPISQNKCLLDYFLPRIRSNFELLSQYKPQNTQVLQAPITVIAAQDDDNLEAELIMDWQHYTQSQFQMHWCEGGHFYWYDSPSFLLDRINSAVQELVSAHKLEHKKRLLKALLQKKAVRALASPAQCALWALRHPDSPAYHLKFTARIVPTLKKTEFEGALKGLIQCCIPCYCMPKKRCLPLKPFF